MSFNLFPKLKAARIDKQLAQEAAGNLTSRVIDLMGENHSLREAVIQRTAALNEIVQTVDNVKSPNGTSRKILRIALSAL